MVYISSRLLHIQAYGQTFIQDDVFLATVGAFAAVFNAGGRIAWGHLADRFSFKVQYGEIQLLVVHILIPINASTAYTYAYTYASSTAAFPAVRIIKYS